MKRTIMSAGEKGKLEDVTKVYKLHYGSHQRKRKEVQEFQYVVWLPSTLPLSVLYTTQKSRESILEILQKNWENKE